MRGHSIRHPLDHLGQSHVGFGNHLVTFESFLRNVAVGVVGWLIGTQLLAGWHVATIGSFNYATDGAYGLIGAVVTLAIAAICHRAGVRLSRSGFGVAMALSLVFIAVAYPCGAVLGAGWNSTFGQFPDMSGLGNRALP